MGNPSEPRPQCPECGRVLHPRHQIIVVSESDELDDSIPDGMPTAHVHADVFAGLYCSSECVLDAMRRGWPEYRAMTDGIP